MFRRIANCQYSLPSDSTDFKLSYAARDLVAKMLTKEWSKRPTVDECLIHPWISGDKALAEKLPERILKNLVNFGSQSKLRKLVAKVLAQKMKLTDKGRLDGLFQKYDKDGDGTLGQKETAEMLTKMGANQSHGLTNLLRSIDENGDGSITKDEFFFAQALGELGIDDQKIDEMFNYFDTDMDGYVTLSDLVAKCHLEGGEAEAKKIVQEVDFHGDGRINRMAWRIALKDVAFKGTAVNSPHRQSLIGYEFSPSALTAAQKGKEQQSRPTSKSALVVTDTALKSKIASGDTRLDAAIKANPGGSKGGAARAKDF